MTIPSAVPTDVDPLGRVGQWCVIGLLSTPSGVLASAAVDPSGVLASIAFPLLMSTPSGVLASKVWNSRLA